MKKNLIILLMAAALAAVSHAVVIDSFLNADFDSEGGGEGGPFDGFDENPEILGWTNYPAGPLNDAGVEGPGAWWGTYENRSAFMSVGDAAYNMSSYVIESGDVFNVSFVGKSWDNNSQWTVSLFYDNPANVIGSFTATLNGTWTLLSNATPIVATAPSVGGTLGILFENTGTGFSNLDEVTVVTVPLAYNAPANGATLISPVRTDAENDLVFTVNAPKITKVDVQLGTENDPNLTTAPAYQIVNDLPVTLGQYTVNLQDLAADLLYDKTYYWKVIGYEPNTVPGATDFIAVPGPVWSFTTTPETPVFADDPDLLYVFEGETAVFTAACDSVSAISSVKWFKAGTPDAEVTEADADVTISTAIDPTAEGYTATSTLTIANTDAADLGSYYMQATNVAGPKQSASADLLFKELLAYWPFDGDLLDATGNGNNGTAMSTATSTTLVPTFGTGQVGQALSLEGTESYIDLPDGLGDDFRGGLTFNVWAYPRAAANWARFLSFNNGSDNDNIFLARNGTGATLRFHVYKGTSSAGGVLDAANALALNAWQMFTVTMSATGQAVLYKNGVQIASGTVQTPNVIARTNNWIGRSAWPDALYNGFLDEIRVYNYPLTPEDVALLYTSATPEADWICVDNTDPALAMDLNNDCQVDIDDLVEVINQWLECPRVPASACNE